MKLTRDYFMGWALHRAALELASYQETSFEKALDFIVEEALAAGLEVDPETQDQTAREMVFHFDCVVAGQQKGT